MRPLRRGLGALAIAASVLAFGCTDPPATPSTNAPFSQTDLVLGTGSTATAGGTLTVNYTGWFYDVTKSDKKGLQFDSSIGSAPFTFVLGTGQVIQGWEQGLAGMRVGGERLLIIPPPLAYGNTRNGIVPPNTTLVFDITLLNVQ